MRRIRHLVRVPPEHPCSNDSALHCGATVFDGDSNCENRLDSLSIHRRTCFHTARAPLHSYLKKSSSDVFNTCEPVSKDACNDVCACWNFVTASV